MDRLLSRGATIALCALLGLLAFRPAVAAAAAVGGDADNIAHVRRPQPEAWSRVYIQDVYARAAVRRALTDAAAWLASPGCQGLLLEFRDTGGRPLTEKLAEMGGHLEQYLRLLVFLDASDSSTCRRDGVLAFTTPGSRLVYVCGRDFQRARQREPEQAPSVIIHEMLHSLGLPERPPSASYITHRVQQACWP